MTYYYLLVWVTLASVQPGSSPSILKPQAQMFESAKPLCVRYKQLPDSEDVHVYKVMTDTQGRANLIEVEVVCP